MRMFGLKRSKVMAERKVLGFSISRLGIQPSTPKRCAVCAGPATQSCFRANAAGVADRSSRRWACEDHANVEELFPVRLAAGPNVMTLGDDRKLYGFGNQGEDMFMFYREIVKSFGGELEPVRCKDAPPRHRKFNPEPLPPPRPLKTIYSRVNRGSLSGRQWNMFRRQFGIHEKSR